MERERPHGGVSGSNPSDWFLRSTFIVGPPIVVPPEPPILPPEPPPQVLPPGVFPIIGPEIATYGPAIGDDDARHLA